MCTTEPMRRKSRSLGFQAWISGLLLTKLLRELEGSIGLGYSKWIHILMFITNATARTHSVENPLNGSDCREREESLSWHNLHWLIFFSLWQVSQMCQTKDFSIGKRLSSRFIARARWSNCALSVSRHRQTGPKVIIPSRAAAPKKRRTD